jgi:ATP-dependent Clp protease adapter protein ClpS
MMPTHSDTQLNMIGRLFRRSSSNKKRVKTLERETEPPATKQEKKDRKPYYRVMLHSTEWQPEIVARLLPRAIPALDRVAAFELCLSARYNGKVALIITRKKQAEEYCMALQRLGLPSTIELHDIER